MTKFVVLIGFIVSFSAGLVIGRQWRATTTTVPPGVEHTAVAQGGGDDDRGGGHGRDRDRDRDGGDRDGDRDRERDGNRGRGGWLAHELKLTEEQQQKLDKIWSETARNGRGRSEEARRQYRKERDEAIQALVSESAKAEYDQIQQTYADRIEAFEDEMRNSYRAAVERTKEILTPEQRAKYEDLLKRHRWGPPGPRDHHKGRRPEDRATSRPGH